MATDNPDRCPRIICGVTVLVQSDKVDTLNEALTLVMVGTLLAGAVLGVVWVLLLAMMFPLWVSLFLLLGAFFGTLHILRKMSTPKTRSAVILTFLEHIRLAGPSRE